MLRHAVAVLMALGSAAGAQTMSEAACAAAFAALTGPEAVFPVTGTLAGVTAEGCVIRDLVLDMGGEFAPDWHATELRLSGSALDWLAGEAATPETLEVAVRGLRFEVSTGNSQMDYLLAAQARAAPTRVDLALDWDRAAKVLVLSRLEIDFPGDNAVSLSARVANVDLSSEGALQMSATGFALTEADLSVTSHGLFEHYVLMSLGPSLLPLEGDMAAAMAALQAEATAALADLPEATFPAATKDAVARLIAEMPNPSGQLDLAVRADPGFGPARFAGYAMTGVPQDIAGVAPMFDGVTINMDWQHAAAE